MTEPSPDARTLPELFANTADATTLSWFADDLYPAPGWAAPPADPSGWCVLDGASVRDHVRTLAAGLIDLGVSSGEQVALMMGNRPEHWLTDLAVLHAGAVPSTFYPTLAPEQVRAQAAHARISTVVIEGEAQFEQWSLALELPELRRVIVLGEETSPRPSGRAWQTYAETLDRGAARLAVQPEVVTQRAQRIGPEDFATIIFTSGTTATPKAVTLTHHNVVAVAAGLSASGITPASYRSVSYLPTAHILDRLMNIYVALLLGGHISFSPTQDSLTSVMARARPTSLIGVPRIWAKVLARLEQLASDDPAGNPLRTAGLDELALAGTGGAPTPAALADGLRRYGLPLVDAWGLTETAGTITASTVTKFRAGTVGRALPGCEVRLASDGELLVRGAQVSPGYLQPDGTLTPITDKDGWLATGDVGSIDEDGYVSITDRKKEIIITSGGKNVSPVAVESMLINSSLIAQALAFGNGHPYVVALLTLDPEPAGAWLKQQHGIDPAGLTDEALAAHPSVRGEVARVVDDANAGLARSEQVKRWELLPRPWNPAEGTLTPTLKLRRTVIETRHRDVLEGLYRPEGDTPEGPP